MRAFSHLLDCLKRPFSDRLFLMIERIRFVLALVAVSLLAAESTPARGAETPESEEARLLRFPAIHGEQVVFSYSGDLYTVGIQGGIARRLTSDVGYEIFPKFSPDGKTIAFTAQYDGNSEVYLMPAQGGEPQRISWTPTLGRDDISDRMGPNNIVMGWKGSEGVIFRSRGLEFNDWKGRLLVAPTDGGMTTQLPFSRGGWCSLSPDGKKLAYNRVFREFRTWKRYRGGQADDIWVYDFETGQSENITQNPAQDIFPMWYGNKIYFVSDRDEIKRMNLYSYDLGTKETRRHTDFVEYDVKYPSLCDRTIAFENGGFIYKVNLDAAEPAAEKITVQLAEDHSQRRSRLRDVSGMVASFDVSPDGKRAVFGARGDIFTIPVKYGETRNLTTSSGVHERDVTWSPDGKWIAYISDVSGEDEIWIQPQDGKNPARQVTQGGTVYKYAPQWSPDSLKIAWTDRSQKLKYVEVESGKVTEAAYSPKWEITDFNWSPDSLWLTWAHPEEEGVSRIYLYSLESGVASPVTDLWYPCQSPLFSKDGKYLFFVSSRDFSPVSSQIEFNYAYFDMERIYLVTLAADTPSPFKPLSDEATAGTEEKKEDKEVKEAKAEASKVKPIKVDLEGIAGRIAAVPGPASSYYNLASLEDKLFYQRSGSRDSRSSFVVYDFKERKETDLGSISSFTIAAQGKKMLVRDGSSYGIIDIPSGKVELKERLNLSGLEVTLNLQEEWKQIFNECWRQMRDYMFDPNLHGVDWKLMRERYSRLLDAVNVRQDLTYVIGEMIGELSIGHSYVGDGDYAKPVRIPVGLLGADIVKEPETGAFRIVKIYPGQNWAPDLRSPLTEIGVNAREGDYILSINGKPSGEIKNIYEALNNTAGKQVTLCLNARPETEGSREVVVIPTGDEQGLRYFNWVEGNIQKVNQATGGRVGYIHIPDMGVPGMNEFVKHFYPQLTKEALIIDVRGNGGGNVSPQITERLLREPVMVRIARNTTPGWEPAGMQVGPKVCLLDELSASDGDIFSYRFRHYKLGPLVGKRSWGGVVGIRGSLPLLDGGTLRKPEFSRYDLEGKEWIMEGHGVDPDIEVENDPAREFLGEDAQLSRGIEEVLKALETQRVQIPPPPAYPDKSK